MKKYFWILAPLVWIASLVILIIALTNLVTVNPFKEYRLIIGIGFLCLSGLIGTVHKKFISK
jgi:hypothetical protein